MASMDTICSDWLKLYESTGPTNLFDCIVSSKIQVWLAENLKLFYLKLKIPMIYNFVQIMFVMSSSHTPYMSPSSTKWLPWPWVHIIRVCDWLKFDTWFMKKGLKIPKEQSESVNLRRTDNTIANRKRTKAKTTIYKTLHQKLKIEQHEHH